MPLYFFHVRSADDFIRDDEGIDLPDLARAHEEAVLGARGILKEQIDRNQTIDGQRFDVTNVAGELLFSYAFKDSIKLP